nr:MAG TPA_asm: hypothetical protein [Caudoviricetes sp.]
MFNQPTAWRFSLLRLTVPETSLLATASPEQ